MRGALSADYGRAPKPAYLDAGTATIVFQALIAGILGALFLFKSFWWRMLGFVRTLLGYSSPPNAAQPQPHSPGCNFSVSNASVSRVVVADEEATTSDRSGDGTGS
jgi:hypothetical protein